MGRPDTSLTETNVAEQIDYQLRLLGAGAANPVKELGYGMSVARTGVGVFRITWPSFPGAFVNMSYTIGATTMSAVAGFTLTRGVPAVVGGLWTLDVSLWNAANAAVELAAAQYLDLTIRWKETSV